MYDSIDCCSRHFWNFPSSKFLASSTTGTYSTSDSSCGRPPHRKLASDFCHAANSVYHRADNQHLFRISTGVSVLGNFCGRPLFSQEFATGYRHSGELTIHHDISALKLELQQHPFFSQIEELKRRKRVLRRLGYVKFGDVMQLKGHVACEISSGDELLLTELLFNGVFNALTPEEVCSLLSCLIYKEGSCDRPILSEPMLEILKQMQDVARRVAKVSIDARLAMDEDKYIESFRPDMMEVVYAWCNGSSFSQICEITEVYEGSIIRCMRRLQETLQQMYRASKGIGNAELEIKFCRGISTIKRNIVNACSLYLPKEV